MAESPLKSLAEYSRFVAELFDSPLVQRSTVTLWSDSPYTGIADTKSTGKKSVSTGTTTSRILATHHWLQPSLTTSMFCPTSGGIASLLQV
jgi:hypothetical protein